MRHTKSFALKKKKKHFYENEKERILLRNGWALHAIIQIFPLHYSNFIIQNKSYLLNYEKKYKL